MKKYIEDFEARRRSLFLRIPSLVEFEELYLRVTEINFCIKDLSGYYVSVNDAFMSSVPDLCVADVIGKTAFDLYPHELAVGYTQQDQKLLADGRSLHDQLEMITNSDGTTGWYITSKVLAHDHLGNVCAIIAMSRTLNVAIEKADRHSQLAIAIETIKERFAEPLKISELAKQCGITLSQLESLMRSMISMTPRQYLTRIRVEAAANLMATTEESITEISQQCGFSHQAAFYRQFKTTTGLTPLSYRKIYGARSEQTM